MKIFLIGFMGSGKSFVGKRLAEGLNLTFYDLDDYIEKNEKRSITQIFEQDGADYFRQQERKYLLEFKSIENAVIACGGGTPCFFDNMDWINENGISIYLQAPAVILLKRLKKERDHRPLLRGKSDEELLVFIKEKGKERNPFYTQASIIYHCHSEDNDVVGEILSHLSYTNWRLEAGD